ncbi:gas vesicle protein GvpG [Dactylosporangium sp. CA-052675]|uniref:gas vesicle protein GvpG n=1 Tax=Dactylosporangium sp. CA-052675 TaxID=3239927 RepID=UPI003D90B7EB
MGLITAILTAPLAPVRVVVWAGELIRDQVNHELFDPGVIRRQIQQIDEARAAGRIDPAEADRRQQELISRLLGPVGNPEEEG